MIRRRIIGSLLLLLGVSLLGMPASQAKDIGLLINGVEITPYATDLQLIPGVGNGISYDENSKTLTLENATITIPEKATTYPTTTYAIENKEVVGLTILLIGDNIIIPGKTLKGDRMRGLHLYKSTTIKGAGSLTITTNKKGSEDYAVSLVGAAPLTIEECHVKLSAKHFAVDGGKLAIAGAKVEMDVEDAGGFAIRNAPISLGAPQSVKIGEPADAKLVGEVIMEQDGKTPVKSVKLIPIPTSITLEPSSPKELTVEETLQLTATVAPEHAIGKDVAYTVKDGKTDIVSVSADGLVTAKGPGTATVVAQPAEGFVSATIEIAVTQPVAEITLNEKEASLKPGEDLQLTATITPANATDKSVEWSSSDKDVASVDQTGKVSAHKVGKATITVKNAPSGKAASCEIVVEEPLDTPVSKAELSPYTIAPNPSQGVVSISGLTEPAEVHIYSLLGAELASIQAQPKSSIDLSFLPKGQYIVQIDGIPHRLQLN